MFAILSVTFPFFALVFCGFFATRKGLLPLEAIPGLNTFVLFFALPCMLFRFGSSTPIAVLLDPALALVYLACGLIMVALLVLPAATARMLNQRLPGMFMASAALGGISGVLGALLSAGHAGWPTGAAVVLVGTAFFVASLLLRRA